MKKVEKLSDKKFLGIDWKYEAERLEALRTAAVDEKSKNKYHKAMLEVKEKVVEARKEQNALLDDAVAEIREDQKNISAIEANKRYLRDLFDKFGL